MGRRLETGIGRGGEPRFLADAMLGGLARWLRTLGYDAAHEPGIADAELVRRGREERRLVLTRDRGIPERWWTDHVVRVRADAPLAQLREVNERIPLARDRLFTRCTRCNQPLLPADPDPVADSLPPALRESGRALARCPACERVYWEGSHTARMRREVEAALGSPREGVPPE